MSHLFDDRHHGRAPMVFGYVEKRNHDGGVYWPGAIFILVCIFAGIAEIFVR